MRIFFNHKFVDLNTLSDGETPPKPYPNFRPVHHVPAAERRPPNLYDSTVYGSSPSAITLTPKECRPRQPSKMVVPGVPGAFMVLDVFTSEECLQIVKAAEAIGFEKDEAAAGSAIMKTSVSIIFALHVFANVLSDSRPKLCLACRQTILRTLLCSDPALCPSNSTCFS